MATLRALRTCEPAMPDAAPNPAPKPAPNRARVTLQRGLALAAVAALLGNVSGSAQTTTAIPAASCLRLNHTAQAVTAFNNLGPQARSAEARATFALLRSSEQALQRDQALTKLAAMPAVQASWQSLDKAFSSLPDSASVGVMQQQLHGQKQAYRQALNGLIVSITCQP